MKILLILLTLLPSISIAKDITYLDYKLTIPDDYKVIKNNLSDTSNGIFILPENKEFSFSIEKIIKNKHFFSLKDSGTNSHRELLHILFSDVPSSNKYILELRGFDKNFLLQKRSISKKDNFVFFRLDNGMDLIGTTYFVSTPINDEVLKFSFPEEVKEALIQSVIDSLGVK